MGLILPLANRTLRSHSSFTGACLYYFGNSYGKPLPITVHPGAMRFSNRRADEFKFTPETFTGSRGLVAVNFFQKVYFSDFNDDYAWMACTVAGTWRPANSAERRVLEQRFG